MTDILAVLALMAFIAAILGLMIIGLVRVLSVIASLFRRSPPKRPGGMNCPYCARETARDAPRCAWCGRALDSATAAELVDLRAFLRQVERLCNRGVIEPTLSRMLEAKAAERRSQLLRPEPVPAPAPARPTEGAAAMPPVPSKAVAPAPPAPPTAVPAEPKRQPQPVATQTPMPPTPQPVLAPARAVPGSRSPSRGSGPRPAGSAAGGSAAGTKKSWIERLGDFLEDRNIPLAEPIGLLIGAMLIIGPSIALAISFREQWENIYFQFGAFVTVAAAIFGIGLYTYHRWKLQTIGTVVLLIATVFVPLVFLAIARASQGSGGPLVWGLEVAALLGFVYLVGLASRVLVPGSPWLASLAVMGNSAAVLAAGVIPDAWAQGTALSGVGLVPVAVFAAAIAPYLLVVVPRGNGLNGPSTMRLFTFLGAATFALAVALGLLLARGAEVAGLAAALRDAAPICALAAVPILSAGLAVVQGTSRDPSLGAYRTVGTAIALIAVAGMIAALAMAWPRPLSVAVVGALDAVALVYLAMRHRFPAAHAGAAAAVALVYLLAVHMLAGSLDPAETDGAAVLRSVLVAPGGLRSGTSLVGLFVAMAAAAEWLVRRGLNAHGAVYAGASVAVALVSLTLVTQMVWTGGTVAAAIHPMIVYTVYGLGSLALAARWRRQELGYFGLGLVLGASLWALWWQTEEIAPLWAAVLAVEALVLALAGVGLRIYLRTAAAAGGRGIAAAQIDPASAPSRLASSNETAPSARPVSRVAVFHFPLLHSAEAAAAAALGFGAWTWEVPSTAHAVAAASLTAVMLTLAWTHRSPARTWIASAVLLLGLLEWTLIDDPGRVAWPYVASLLAHATVATLAGVGLAWGWDAARAGRTPQAEEPGPGNLACVLVEPLLQSATITSTAALVLLLHLPGRDALGLAACLGWVAALWLVMGWKQRLPAIWQAAQAVLSGAAVAGAVAWIERHPWEGATSIDLFDPRSLQTMGMGLGLLTSAWLAVRIATRGNQTLRQLLEPDWPSVDWLVGHALVFAQFLLAASVLGAPCWDELGRRPFAGPYALHAAALAWWLAGLMLANAVLAFWHRWGAVEVASTAVAAATMPYLIAWHSAEQVAAASAARWALAFTGLAMAGVVLARRPLKHVLARVGAKLETGPEGPVAAQAVVIATALVPVVCLTFLAAVTQLAGWQSGGPIAGPFASLSANVSYLVPLAVVIVALVGFALGEASAGYAFAAGLVVQMTVVLGYLLNLTATAQRIGIGHVATAVQLATIAAASWTLVWLAVRRRLNVWREGPERSSSRTLMDLQVAMGLAGNALVLLPALAWMIFAGPHDSDWVVAAGSPWGWTAMILAAAAAMWRQGASDRVPSSQVAGLAGMAAMGLLACTVARVWPDVEAAAWGYRTLMLGWGCYALLVALATWWVASVRTLPGAAGPPQALVRAASSWVIASGSAATALGLKAALVHGGEDTLWGAAAIALASLAGATMAVWRRKEAWAFAAAPGVNLAASLVVWHFERAERLNLVIGDWWVLLVQSNVIATAAVALVWLAARKRLYELREISIRTSPLLALQTLLGAVGLSALLLPAAGTLAIAPDRSATWTAALATPPGWIALALVTAAAAWYLLQVSPRDIIHALGSLLLGTGILLACDAPGWGSGVEEPWRAYHVLLASWSTAAFLLFFLTEALRTARLGHRLARLAMRYEHHDSQASPAREDSTIFSRPLTRPWIALVGLLVVALAAVHAPADPSGPWWSTASIAAISLVAGLVAVAHRAPVYVDVSGVLLNVAATLLWTTFAPWDLFALVQANALALAIGAALWTAVQFAHPAGEEALRIGGRRETFPRVATQLAVAIQSMIVVAGIVLRATDQAVAAPGKLAWTALGATAAALVVQLADRGARFALPGLYLSGLIAIGLGLLVGQRSPLDLACLGCLELASFALATGLLGRISVELRSASRAAAVAVQPDRWPAHWYPAMQGLVAAVAGMLGIWISLDSVFGHVRTISILVSSWDGPVATAMLLGAAVATASLAAGPWRTGWQLATFGLAALTLSEVGWVALGTQLPLPWLHRNVVLLVASAACGALAGLGVPRIFGPENDWTRAARQSAGVLGAVALAAFSIVLGQEIFYSVAHPYDPKGVPMEPWAIGVVLAALAALAVTAVVFALSPHRDPLGLEQRRRQIYVYLAEALVVLVGLHLRLTVPEWFDTGLVRQYWMLVVMAVAFAGAGLSELFQRRNLPVLAEPLARTAIVVPLAPAIGFPLEFFGRMAPVEPLAGASPAVWFLGGLFYGILATTKRKARFAIASVLSLNIGLWVLWDRLEFGFLDHPQLWLIPVGLCILLAEYVNHDRLAAAQSAGLRYVALGMIYISSSVECLPAVGQPTWLPLALILLALLGVVTGLALRIRSFLYMGVIFLLLVLGRIVQHAYVDQNQTWVLWVCCILLGAATIAAVGVYEKHRAQILAGLRQFRGWQR